MMREHESHQSPKRKRGVTSANHSTNQSPLRKQRINQNRDCKGAASLTRCIHKSFVPLLVTLLAILPTTIRASEPAPTSPPAKKPPTTPNDSKPPTPEDILKALQDLRPPNDIIPPASAAHRPAEEEGPLWPEGWSLIGVTGTIEFENDWWMFSFTDPETNKPLRLKLLPNSTLEIMARSSTGPNKNTLFVVYGNVTVFKNENYLLPKTAARSNVAPTKADAPSTSPPTIGSDASTEDVVAQMNKQKPTEEIVTGNTTGNVERSTITSRSVIPEGSPIVNRPGRLVRSGNWWTFVTEADHPDHAEPAFRVLPGRPLETMAEATERDPTGLVYVVSGELTSFQGENYLFAKGAYRRIDTGNLSK